jgi:hypothetical protein
VEVTETKKVENTFLTEFYQIPICFEPETSCNLYDSFKIDSCFKHESALPTPLRFTYSSVKKLLKYLHSYLSSRSGHTVASQASQVVNTTKKSQGAMNQKTPDAVL